MITLDLQLAVVYWKLFAWGVVYLLWPGICLLALVRGPWMARLESTREGRFLLFLPTSFGLSLGVISVWGWVAYWLDWGFSGARNLTLATAAILTLLLVGSVVSRVVWSKGRPFLLQPGQQARPRALIADRKQERNLRLARVALVVILAIVTILAAYAGPWFSHTADSFSHIAAIRSLMVYNRALPQEVHFPNPTDTMSPSHGTWHLALALLAEKSEADVTTVWRFATVALAPLVALAFATLARTLTRSVRATLLATGFYVFLDALSSNFDLRVIAHTNRMGHAIFWLILIWIVAYCRIAAARSKDPSNRDARLGQYTAGFFLALFGFEISAIHMQYVTNLVIFSTVAAAVVLAVPGLKAWRSRFMNAGDKARNQATGKSIQAWWRSAASFLGRPFLKASTLAIATSLPIFLYKTAILLSSGKASLTDNSIAVVNTVTLVPETDLQLWSSSDPLVFLVSVLAIVTLVSAWRQGDIGAVVALTGVCATPLAALILGILPVSGGLIGNAVQRLAKSMTPFIYLTWGWGLVIVLDRARTWSRRYLHPFLWLLVCAAVAAMSLFFVVQSITSEGGLGSIYSPTSTYKASLQVSRESDLTDRWRDAVEEVLKLPSDAIVLSDNRTSYMLNGLTGVRVLAIPSQHTAVNEKPENYKGYEDVERFMTAELAPREEILLLARHNVTHVFLGEPRFSGEAAWEHIQDLPVFEEIASGDDWALYRYLPDHAELYVKLWEEKEQITNSEDKALFYRNLAALYPNKEQFSKFAAKELGIDPAFTMGYLLEGEDYRSPKEAGASYSLLDHFFEATSSTSNPNYIRRSALLIDRKPQGIIFQHPSSTIEYQLQVPVNSSFTFSIALTPDVWSAGKGDGVGFAIYLRDKSGTLSRLFSRYIDPKNVLAHRKWHDHRVDLSSWSGEVVTLILSTTPGPNDSSAYDWAAWGEPRIVQPVAYDFLEHVTQPEIVNLGQVEVATQTIGYEPRPALLQRPVSQATYSITLPLQPSLQFGIGLDADDDQQDTGVPLEFNIYVCDLAVPRVAHQIFHRVLRATNNPEDQRWHDEAIDLDAFGGRPVQITFEISVPSGANHEGERGAWSQPVIIDLTLPDDSPTPSSSWLPESP